MHSLKNKLGILGLLLIGLVTFGCLISGTFVIVEGVNFNFTANTGFYWYPVDLTGNSDWEEHEDKIDFIDAIGFSFVIQNTSSENCEFNVWFVGATGDPPGSPPLSFPPTGGVQVISGLEVAAGSTRTVTYAESLTHLINVEEFKHIVMTGRFDYYGTSCGGTDDDEFIVTNGKIIVTVSASST
jgi:hypothetical protein